MRVEASEVLAQTTKDRNPDKWMAEPIGVSYGRASRLAEIEQAAIDFADNFLLDFDLPSTPILKLGNIRGFENPKKAVIEIIGVIHVNAKIKTLNGHVIRMDLAIPMYKGEFQRPSVVYYKDKKQIFSQDFINTIVGNIETNRPKVYKPLTPSMGFQRSETIEKPLFSAPDDPSGWSLLITERY